MNILTRKYSFEASYFINKANLSDKQHLEAINFLVRQLKNNNLWDKFVAIYPIVGGNQTSHSLNLVSDNYTIQWEGTTLHNNRGCSSNGSDGCGNTSILHSDITSFGGLSVYLVDEMLGAYPMFISSFSSDGYTEIGKWDNNNQFYSRFFNNGAVLIGNFDSKHTGLVTIQRDSTQYELLYQNSTLKNTQLNSTPSAGTALPFYVMSRNSGSRSLFTPNSSYFGLFALLKSSVNINIWSDIINQYQTILGRQA
jgi:hypothetical protein